jgi:hypothetical protein
MHWLSNLTRWKREISASLKQISKKPADSMHPRTKEIVLTHSEGVLIYAGGNFTTIIPFMPLQCLVAASRGENVLER